MLQIFAGIIDFLLKRPPNRFSASNIFRRTLRSDWYLSRVVVYTRLIAEFCERRLACLFSTLEIHPLVKLKNERQNVVSDKDSVISVKFTKNDHKFRDILLRKLSWTDIVIPTKTLTLLKSFLLLLLFTKTSALHVHGRGPMHRHPYRSFPHHHSKPGHHHRLGESLAGALNAARQQEAHAQGLLEDAGIAGGAEFGDPNAYAQALQRDVYGGGVTGYNLGGANSPQAATSNVFHNPVEAALHETGPFGTNSPLTRNMMQSDDPTVLQRMQESGDTVHDDNLKANVATKESLENSLQMRAAQALAQMKEVIKENAAQAALMDAEASLQKANVVAAQAPNGDLDAVMPGTNRTFRDVVDELLAAAEHHRMHANNKDLYLLEYSAEKSGLPSPTLGKDLESAALRDLLKRKEQEAVLAKEQELAMAEERRSQAQIAAEQQAIAQSEAEALERERQAVEAEQREATDAAAANDMYVQAANQAAIDNLQTKEAAVANALTAAQVRQRAAELASIAQGNAAVQESAVLQAAAAAQAVQAANQQATESEIARNEALVAAMGEQAKQQQQLADLNRAIANMNAARESLERQAAAEAVAAEQNAQDMKAALDINPEDLSRLGEAAIEAGSLHRGSELSRAAAQAAAIAEAARQRGAVLAAAKEAENAVAENTRLNGEILTQHQLDAAEKQQRAAAEAAQLAARAAREQRVAAVIKQEREEIEKEAEKLKEEEEASGAGFEKDDPYKILGTIPDDADTVAIKNSSIQFPLKTFGTAKAHNQAEAGALAAQNKIKDDIRGKVTADKFDTPLNVIKGESGYLNVPENAEKVEIEDGRVYMTESGIQQMNREGIDTSMFEQKINTGERSDMGIGLKYYVADTSGMTMDVPSPGNPDPPRVLVGKNKVIDVSRAEGIDIKKGSLKLEKWQEYSRKIRPTVNVSIHSNGHEAIIEAFVDDDCIKQALKDADVLYNTVSELHINPSGEKYITLRPPYGVTETLRFDEAVANLNRIQQSCRITHGQTGISIMQESDLKSNSTQHSERKQINVAESSGEVCITSSEEERIRMAALQQAANLEETHKIIQRENAFDHKTHDSKEEIIENGAKNIEVETGRSREEVINEVGNTREEIEAAKEELIEKHENSLDSNEQTTREITEEVKKEEEAIRDAGEIKMMIQKESSMISKELGISEEEFTSMVSNTSINIFKSLILYARNPQSEKYKEIVHKMKSELKLIFGTHTETFSKIIYANISKKFKISDPEEPVIIKKETTLVPMIIGSETTPNALGGHTTTFKQGLVPRTIITRIPLRRRVVLRGGNVAGKIMQYPNAPVGPVVAGKLDPRRSDAKPTLSTLPTASELLGPGGLGAPGEKIKLGDHGTLIGMNNEIDQMVDPESIGNITKPEIVNQTEIKNTGIQEKGTSDTSSGRVLEEEVDIMSQDACKGLTPEQCKEKLTTKA